MPQNLSRGHLSFPLWAGARQPARLGASSSGKRPLMPGTAAGPGSSVGQVLWYLVSEARPYHALAAWRNDASGSSVELIHRTRVSLIKCSLALTGNSTGFLEEHAMDKNIPQREKLDSQSLMESRLI